ncbi:hypothetical protein EV356DRAFT_531729 [Viridothelium virens]|uniref:Rad60/SUMO-like domain-containing protein n=1 Tax=Viridothelium virens TaxID=1048519 RepID=A0A6A6HBZ1_VIRVR|nr:hypothetical protein EV356DRAFT_531729 [Viridothelium virens]
MAAIAPSIECVREKGNVPNEISREDMVVFDEPDGHGSDALNVLRTTHTPCSWCSHARQRITVKVKNNDHYEVHYRIGRDEPMVELMKRYKARTGLEDLRFSVDEERLTDDATADSLYLEDGDIIDVFTGSYGG